MTYPQSLNPHVSVLMPSYNHAPFIEEALESVFAQTYRDYEIVIVDDGSTDATPELIKKYESRIRLFLCPHRGVSATYTFALNQARGPWIAFLETDDMWEPTYLEKALHFLQAQPSVAWVSTSRQLIDTSGNMLDRIQRRTPPHSLYSLGEMLAYPDAFALYCPTPVVKRDALMKIGELSPHTLSCDIDMGLRFALHFPMGYLDEPLYIYRIHSANLSSTKQFKTGEEHLRVFQRFSDSYSNHLMVREKKLLERTLSLLSNRVQLNRFLYRENGTAWPRRRDLLKSLLVMMRFEPLSLEHYRRFLLLLVLGVRGSYYLRKLERKTRSLRK